MKTLLLLLLLTLPAIAQPYEAFWSMYELESIEEKKEIWGTLSHADKVVVRRMNIAWGVGYLRITDERKLAYLGEFSLALPGMSREDAEHFQREAIELFTANEGGLLFGSIGPYKPCSIFTKPSVTLLSCPCSVGSSFNMQCDGECINATGGCSVRSTGCGFAWIYSCDGQCQLS